METKRTSLAPPPDDDNETSYVLHSTDPFYGTREVITRPKKKASSQKASSPKVHPHGSMKPPPEETEDDSEEIARRKAHSTLTSSSRQAMRSDIVETGFRIPDTLSGTSGFETSQESTPVSFAGESALPTLMKPEDSSRCDVFAPKVELRPSRDELRRRLREKRFSVRNTRRSDTTKSIMNQRAATKLNKAASSKNEAEAKAAKQQIMMRDLVVKMLNESATGSKNAATKKMLSKAADNVYGHGMRDGLAMSQLPQSVINTVLMKAGLMLAKESPDMAKDLLGFGPDGPSPAI